MIEHWMATPPNGYIGLSYGRNPRQLLQLPLETDTADQYLNWMREDIPVLKQLSENDLSIVTEQVNFETKIHHIKLGNILLPIQTVTGNKVVGG
jgi:hypothetical protein